MKTSCPLGQTVGESPKIHLENGGDPGSNPGGSIKFFRILCDQRVQLAAEAGAVIINSNQRVQLAAEAGALVINLKTRYYRRELF